MKYNKLGNSTLEVSTLCLGTMTFGEQNSEQDGHHQLDYAVSQGVNFIDTAEMYPVPGKKETQGETERIIGTWLKNQKREDLIVSSKIIGPATWNTYMRGGPDYSKGQLNEAVDGSLRRLQTDYIDVYQLHWPERKTNFFGKLDYKHDEDDSWEDNFQEVLLSLKGLIDSGKVKYIGISNETAWGAMKFLHYADKLGLPKLVCVQNPYSLLNRVYEIAMAEISMREDVGLLAYSPLAFGMLTGKYRKNKTPEKARLTLFPRMARYSGDLSFQAVEKYAAIAEKHNLSLTQMSLAFINSREFLGANIIGATTMEQLKENIASIDVALSEEVLKEIEEVHQLIPNPAP